MLFFLAESVTLANRVTDSEEIFQATVENTTKPVLRDNLRERMELTAFLVALISRLFLKLAKIDLRKLPN
jgi:hypothetical protein